MHRTLFQKLTDAQSVSPSLNAALFFKRILPPTLLQIGLEAIGAKVPADLGDRPYSVATTDRITGSNGSLKIKLVRPEAGADRFTSVIDVSRQGELDHFTIVINEDQRGMERIEHLAINIGHILLHRDYLSGDPFAFTMVERTRADEEGVLFAQLCYWPLGTLFPQLGRSAPNREDDKIVADLRRSYEAYCREAGEPVPGSADIEELCSEFFQSLNWHLPEYYTYIKYSEPFLKDITSS